MIDDTSTEVLTRDCLTEDCGKTVALVERFSACPECGGFRVQMTAGDELKVREMEIA